MQQFNIRQYSTLPYLEMELINDGRHDFNKVYIALQAAKVTFTMIDESNNIKKIVNEKCNIVPVNNNGCIEKLKIQYQWKERDTKNKGYYKGSFKIKFTDKIVLEDKTFPKGELIVPIAEDLYINII